MEDEVLQCFQKYPLESAKDYPTRQNKCAIDTSKTEADVNEIDHLKPGRMWAMKRAIYTGPLIVSMEADQTAFQMYKGGIFNDDKCGTKADHVLLIVGYGLENGQSYYIAQNTWGATWGEQGYIKVAMSGDGPGVCGIQNDPIIVRTD